MLSSEHVKTALSLAERDGTDISVDECLHSGAVSPKLVASLSGDVVFPTEAQPEHEIVVIDRTNAAITWLAPRPVRSAEDERQPRLRIQPGRPG
jgi:hypothetical protein